MLELAASTRNFDAPHFFQPLCAPDGDAVDIRTIVRVEGDRTPGKYSPTAGAALKPSDPEVEDAPIDEAKETDG